jgi:hypothetical protein
VITAVGPDGEILEPLQYVSRFCNAVGALVREHMNPAIHMWSGSDGVPEREKQVLWDEWLMVTFRLPEGTHELVRQHTFKMMGNAFQRWRSYLNVTYASKGLTPFEEFGNITHNQWAQFLAEKTSPEALAISKRNSEQAKRNKYHPRLGPGGYKGKQDKFQKLDAAAEASEDPKMQKLVKLKTRVKQWIYARSVDSSALKFAELDIEEAVSRILKYAEDSEKGTFTPSREKDELSLGLGNAEHTGRTRGLGKRTTWKQ